MIDFRKTLPSVLIPAVYVAKTRFNDNDYCQFRFAGGQISRPSSELPNGLKIEDDLILHCKFRSSRLVPVVDSVQYDCRLTNKKYQDMTQETFDAGAFGELYGLVKYQSETSLQIDCNGNLFKVFDVPVSVRPSIGDTLRLIVKLQTTVSYSSFGPRDVLQFVYYSLS